MSTSLLTEIENYLQASGLSATQFGALAMGDTKFVKTLREGRAPRDKTAAQVRAWMKANDYGDPLA